MTVREKLAALREKMTAYKMDMYLIGSEDFHGSEYVGEHFKCRAFISGFTGSAGTILVTQDFAGLWTDGRYFLQAEAQLADTGIELFKMGNEGVPTIEDYIVSHIEKGQCLGTIRFIRARTMVLFNLFPTLILIFPISQLIL